MLSRLFQTTKAICYAVTLALFLQPGGIGCALGCAKTASVAALDECHDAASNDAPATHRASTARSPEHACCHKSARENREAVSAKLAENFHQAGATMQCCMSAEKISVPAVKQRATADKASALAREKVQTPLSIEFRVAPLTGQARLPDRGGTYLRCCLLLI